KKKKKKKNNKKWRQKQQISGRNKKTMKMVASIQHSSAGCTPFSVATTVGGRLSWCWGGWMFIPGVLTPG
ncbi:hypothetical protein, partial [Escherichia coli]|uniref:hypothetical protein n=1 Tax=Escherichia coli TaxID=562 RepID=UPI001BB0B43C